MSKIVEYLQKNLTGEVVANPAVRKYFATDASIFEVLPQFAVYPRNAMDVRKLARFAYQFALKGHPLPIIARGRGTDQTGAAIGRGASLVFPAHMDKIVGLDASKGLVRVQPGVNYRALQDVLFSHGLFLPPYPASMNYSTIGGAIANNAAGEKSVKYGDTRHYVRALEVVLSSGDVITTQRLTKRELNAKKGQSDIEGELYRQIDGLLSDNEELLEKLKLKTQTAKNASGYALGEVRGKDGSFDLTPLLVGSQGTLGIITEATLETEGYNPQPSLLAAQFDSIEQVGEALDELAKFTPSALEIVDKHLLGMLAQTHPNLLKGIFDEGIPAFLVLIEFDDPAERARKKQAKRAGKLLNKLAAAWQDASEPEMQTRLWELCHAAAATVRTDAQGAVGVPIIEDGVVPRSQFTSYITQVYKLLEKHHVQAALWGHAGDAHMHVQPFLNLSKLLDRQKIFQLMDEYHAMLASLGGTMSGEHGDGRLRGPYLEEFYGKGIYSLFQQVKSIFDPQNILNPGVKMGATKAEAMAMLRHDYALPHLSDHLPHL